MVYPTITLIFMGWEALAENNLGIEKGNNTS